MNRTSSSALNQALQTIAELLAQQRVNEAEHHAARFRVAWPKNAEVARLHGLALLMADRIEPARAALSTAVALDPTNVEAHCNLGSTLLAGGEAGQAAQTFTEALRLAPTQTAAWNGLGNAHYAMGDLPAAGAAYRAALDQAPNYPGAQFNLAAVELALGQAEAAEHRTRQALARNPHPQGWLLLGHILAAQDRYAEALDAYNEGAHLIPGDPQFAYQQGLMAEELGLLDKAANAHRRALSLNPQDGAALGQLVFVERQRCAWNDLASLSRQLQQAVQHNRTGISPFVLLAEDVAPSLLRHCAATHAAHIQGTRPLQQQRLRFTYPQRVRDAPLRIGLVANGFHQHATGILTVALLEALRAHPGIESLALYASSPDDGSELRTRLQAAASIFQQTHGLPAPSIAQRIHNDQIEILLDLDGWCAGGRPEVFALRPAPIQVNWLAYPGTSSMPWIDYLIADHFVLPTQESAHYSESIAWLPRCYQPSDPNRPVIPPPSRSALGLPKQGTVFVCFNASFKINPPSFERMLAVLRATPGSVLWLLDPGTDAQARLRFHARTHGIDASRLVFAQKRPHAQYLGLFRHADLFLDCHPYNAHTTASDALWAGCPVLTRPGRSFAARVAGSLNQQLGLDALNVIDDRTFIRIATHLGNHPDTLQSLRQQLQQSREKSGLFNMQAYARDFVTVLKDMARRKRQGLPPANLG